MRILAIDFSHLFFRMWKATGGEELSEAAKRTLQTVATIRHGYDRVTILCDAGQSFRKGIDPAYKADRERQPAPFYEQLRRTVDRLRVEGCSVFDAPEVGIAAVDSANPQGLFAEADDLCASLAQWCIDNGHPLDIYGGDKDLLQCVDDEHGIRILHPEKGIITAEHVMTKFGIAPPRIADMLALSGDDSDNYKPFPKWSDAEGDHPGIGAKTAIELLKLHGTALDVVAMLDAKDAEDNPIDPPWKAHTIKAMRRGLPTPTNAVIRGMNLATLRRDLGVDFSLLLAEPVYASLVAPRNAPSHEALQAFNGAARALAQAEDAAEPYEDATEADPSASTALVPHVAEHGLTRFAGQYAQADAMMALAEKFYDARMFGTFPNASAIFTVLWLATERGEAPATALVNAYVTKPGKPPGYLATYLAARVKASSVCKVFRIVETEATYAVVEYQRIDDPEPGLYRFDLKEAIDAGWDHGSQDSPWRTRPRAMCRAAAQREAAKAFFQDVVSGMADADEDVMR